MASPSEELLIAEVEEKVTSGLDGLTVPEAQEEFSKRLENFLEEKGLEESDIISGQSEYAPILAQEAFNGLDFSGLEGTGLSLSDTRRMLNDKEYRLEMAEKHLTGNEENRIVDEYSESYFTGSPFSPLGNRLVDPVGIDLRDEAINIREFMHYELRDALNSGERGAPSTLEAFEQNPNRFEWTAMVGDQAAFHQNGGETDLKFIHDDGRELVYDGDTKELMTDDRYMGTYNYVNATIPLDSTPSPWEAYQNTRTEGSRLHKAYDVDPWIELGNTRADRYVHGGEEARQAQMNGAIFDGFKSSLGNTVNETGGLISDTASAVGDAVVDTASAAGEVIVDKASAAGEVIYDTASAVGEAVVDKASAAGKTIYDTASAAGESIRDTASAVGETVSDAASAAGAAVSNAASAAGEVVSEKADQVGDAVQGTIEDIKDFGRWLWEGDTPKADDNSNDGAQIQRAAPVDTEITTGSASLPIEEAIDILKADEITLREANLGSETSPIQDALSHPDAAEMFHNLRVHEVETIPAEVTPDMGPEDRVREILVAGQEATYEAGILMPSEQRDLDAAQELHNSYLNTQDSYEDDYSIGH